MAALKNLTGQIFNRLTALRCVARDTRGKVVWLCRCACDGKEIEVQSGHLISGHTQSCGCLRNETTAARNTNHPYFKHGYTLGGIKDPVYRAWTGMIQRCTNPKNPGC